MKKEDLMIGDWVNIQTERDDEPMYSQVEQLWECEIDADFQTDYKNVYPIELTEEILHKNGFLVDSNGIFYLKENLKFGLKKDIDYGYWFANRSDNEYICTCDYVHELQHILKLCKIEKEIVL
jgi:hypothetical protein